MTAPQPRPPLAVVLAGGRGRRFRPGDKAGADLLGRPLISYPIAAIRTALGAAPVVIAKAQTRLPALDADVEVWHDATPSSHPLAGIVLALERAGRRRVFVCAADMALLDAEEVAAIAQTDPGDAAAVVPRAQGRLQPLCALYAPAALPALARALGSDVALTALVESLKPLVVERERLAAYLNVNTAEDLERAAAALQTRR